MTCRCVPFMFSNMFRHFSKWITRRLISGCISNKAFSSESNSGTRPVSPSALLRCSRRLASCRIA